MPYTLTQHWRDGAPTVDTFTDEQSARNATDDAASSYVYAPAEYRPRSYTLRGPDGSVIRQWPNA